MRIHLETGDRVAWSELGRGIIVAREHRSTGANRVTIAVWQDSRFSGHVTRIGTGLLHRTTRLHLPSACVDARPT
jgi:hypothetical protein